MKLKEDFLGPFVMAALIACCLWIVTDVAYGVRIWESGVAAWGKRLEALLVVLVGCAAAYAFFNYLANVSFDRSRDKKPRPKAMEYGWVVFFFLCTFNIGLYVVIRFINHASYRWGEALMINATALPIYLWGYTWVRERVLAEKYKEKTFQLERLKVDRLENELKLLRSQYHPHFLFNALNTVYFQIDEKNEAAIESIELLSDLLRYQLYDIHTKATLREEMEYLQTYIRFQRLRMTERLQFDYTFDSSLADEKIHPLLFQPLLENAFKYVGGAYRIALSLRQEGTGSKIRFLVRNTVSPVAQEPQELQEPKGGAGLGIDNLRKRLLLLYPGKHALRITQDATCFTVDLQIDLTE